MKRRTTGSSICFLTTRAAYHKSSGQQGARIDAVDDGLPVDYNVGRAVISEGLLEGSFLQFFPPRMPVHTADCDVLNRQTSLLICSFAMRSSIPSQIVWRSGMIYRCCVKLSMLRDLA